jgi:DNA-binding SARP family transcriptional activator
MLLGRVAAPLPSTGPDPLGPSVRHVDLSLHRGPVILERVEGADLAAELARSGQSPAWARPAPHDLDPTALAALAGAMLASTPTVAATGPRAVVVESDDDRQVTAFLDQVTTAWPHPHPPIPVVLRPSGRSLPGRQPGPGTAASASARRRRADELTADLHPHTRGLVLLVALLGYCHERFSSLEPVLTECATLPWWTALHGGWWQIRPSWRPAVIATASVGRPLELPMLARVVCELVDDGATDEAIELCLDAGFPGLASDLLIDSATNLVRAQRFSALQRWLERMPPQERSRHGRLAAQLTPAPRGNRPGPRRWWRRHQDVLLPPGVAEEPAPAVTVRALAAPTPIAPTPIASTPAVPVPAVPAPAVPHYAPDHPLVLVAGVLGPLEITIGGQRVDRWRSRKGRALLTQLLLHSGHPLDRDTLGEALWPDVAPEVAGNRLHVTLHGLRRDLRAVSTLPIVVFDQGYALNPELDLQVDAEAFEAAVTAGRQAQASGHREAALDAFRTAVDLYRGDLLGDEPGDEWVLLRREQLRVMMLDARGACARLAFDLGDYNRCIAACHELLALDFCREDLHRLLIRSFARLGQPQLALRQFEACTQQLRTELEMEPGRETVTLLERVKARLPV